MDWKDIVGPVGKFAPILGTLLAGATGGASIAVGALVSACLGTDNTPDAIKTAIATDPAASLKLAQFEIENATKLKEMLLAHTQFMVQSGNDALAGDVADRKSAREAAVGGGTSHELFIMSCILIVFTLGVETYALLHGVPDSVDPMIVGRVLGLMDAVALMVLSFNYGSSTGSKRATELLAQSQPAATPSKQLAPNGDNWLVK